MKTGSGSGFIRLVVRENGHDPGDEQESLGEAKILAIKEEGLRQCASIRVQARHRMRWYRALYLCKLGAVVCVQAYGRRYMYHRFYVIRRRQMDLSQLYRYRILSSYRLQSWLRYTQISREYKVRVAKSGDKRNGLSRKGQHERRLTRDRATVTGGPKDGGAWFV